MASHSMLRPVRHPIVALLAAGAALAGCGAGPTDEDQVRAAVQAFGRATAAKDYRRLCADLLTPSLVAEVRSAGLRCEAALRQGRGEVRYPNLSPGRVTVAGDVAAAAVRTSAAGEQPSRDTLKLQRV